MVEIVVSFVSVTSLGRIAMSHECKCGRPHQFSIHGSCNRCGGRAPQPRHGEGREIRARGWTGSKVRGPAPNMKSKKR